VGSSTIVRGPKQDVTVKTVVVNNFNTAPTTYGEAVVIPDTYTNRATMLTVTLKTGEVLPFNPANLKLEAGKVTTLHITVQGKTAIGVSVTVGNWTADTAPTLLGDGKL